MDEEMFNDMLSKVCSLYELDFNSSVYTDSSFGDDLIVFHIKSKMNMYVLMSADEVAEMLNK